jgi:hypothetical protein
VVDLTGTVGIIMSTIYGYARSTTADPLAGQLAALRDHGIDDDCVFVDDAPTAARPSWSRLLAVLAPGDRVIVARPHVIHGAGMDLTAACGQVRAQSASISPIRAGLADRIAMDGSRSRR